MTDLVYRFGEWLVEPATNSLSREGESHRIEPRAMDVLTTLLAHRGEVVSPDEILDSVWSDRHAEPGMVQKRITQIRQALGDDAREPVYIETIPRRGYRAIAAIDVIGIEANAGGEGSKPFFTKPRMAIAILAIVAFVVFLVLRGPTLMVDATMAFLRFSADPIEQELGFATTTDGVRIAYATSGAGPALVMTNGSFTHLAEGLGSPVYDMAGVLNWYSRNHLLVRYDGRGFGLSDRGIKEFSAETLVMDLEVVVDALELERFALYGYSGAGTRGAIAYAARHPHRVSHLVLTAGHLSSPQPQKERPGLHLMFDAIETRWHDRITRASLVEHMMPDAGSIERGVVLRFLEVAADGPDVAKHFRGMLEMDVTEFAARVSVPTLVVASDGDPTSPLATTRDVASAIPGARFEVLQGVTTHKDAATDNPALMRLVESFLSQPRN